MTEHWPFQEVLGTLGREAARSGTNLMVVGATARDIALAREGQATATRATEDVDVAIAVDSRRGFEAMVSALQPAQPSSQHKFLVHGIEVDVIPFGEIESDDRTVTWPDGTEMNTLGLAEAFPHALPIDLGDGMTVRVASLASQAALKILAWADRSTWTQRDAADLGTIINAYSSGDRLDTIYSPDQDDTLAAYDYEVTLVGAFLLGCEVRATLGVGVARVAAEVITTDLAGGVQIPAALRLRHPDRVGLLEALLDGLEARSPAA